MAALGEIISYMPLSHGFGGYATRFVDPALGFATGYSYFFKYLLATPNQLSAFGLIMKFWVGDRVNPAVFITIILVLILVINSVSVKAFGEFEFWLSSLKVLIMVGVIILLFILAVGGGPTGDRPGFRYWSEPGAFAEYKVDGAKGKLLGLWSAMVAAVYAFSGTELVGVTVGEAKNPRLCMPQAVRLTFLRILFFYVISVFLLGLVVPYNSQELAFAAGAKTSAAASPFVVAIKIARIKGLDHVINACLAVFVFSAANSDIYISSRTLYGIAVDGKAPRVFTRTTKAGVPFVSLALCASFCGLAYMSVSSSAATVFNNLTSLVTVFGELLNHVSRVCNITDSSRPPDLDLHSRFSHLLLPCPQDSADRSGIYPLPRAIRCMRFINRPCVPSHSDTHQRHRGFHWHFRLQGVHRPVYRYPHLPRFDLWLQNRQEIATCASSGGGLGHGRSGRDGRRGEDGGRGSNEGKGGCDGG